MMARKAKFRVGQVVMVRSGWGYTAIPIKIKVVERDPKDFGYAVYKGTDDSWWGNSDLRPLTSREIGPRKARKK
jgi:hypothetical protein